MTKDKTKHNCSNCSAFGKHCPHRVNGDPYHYDCAMTVEDLEEKLANADYQLEGRDNEIAELKADNDARKFAMAMSEKVEKQLREENIKAKDFILKLTTYLEGHTNYDFEYELIKEVKQFLKDSEVEK